MNNKGQTSQVNDSSHQATEQLTIVHFDMDAFFAMIEQRDDERLKGKPLIIGGDPNGRGVVSTASYEARKFGVHSAMSAKQAKQLCPNAIFMRPNITKYKKVSRQIREIFHYYTEIVEPVSIDEAFLKIPNDAMQITKIIKQTVKNQLRLTVSAGISYNRFLAKMASDMQKPDGLTILTAQRASEILPTLNIQKLWGVGSKTCKQLNDIGIETVQDLLNYDREYLLDSWGRRGAELIQLAKGIDNTPVGKKRKSKSIGTETTLIEDTVDEEEIFIWFNRFARELEQTLIKKKAKAKTITIKLKFSSFKSITRAHSLGQYTDKSNIIYETAVRIYKQKVVLNNPVRLVGLTVSNIVFIDEPFQLNLMDDYL